MKYLAIIWICLGLATSHYICYMEGRADFIEGLTVGYGYPYYTGGFYGKCIEGGKYCVINSDE